MNRKGFHKAVITKIRDYLPDKYQKMAVWTSDTDTSEGKIAILAM